MSYQIERYEPAGTALVNLCAGAAAEVVLIAPFMKTTVVKRLLDVVAPEVRVECVTRWRADEVAAKVTDLEVFDVILERKQATLRLLPRLHAKYFRADGRCLIGSANLTQSALGWSTPSNIELLVDQPADSTELLQFEQSVLNSAHVATEELRDLVREAARRIEVEYLPFSNSTADAPTTSIEPIESEIEDGEKRFDFDTWLPHLRQPADLYLAYKGNLDQLSAASRIAATRDLAVLDPGPGLSEGAFGALIGTLLVQMPIIADLDQYLVEPRRFGAVSDRISRKNAAPDRNANSMWQSTMRWLQYFLPGRYQRKVPSHSEIFVRSNRPHH